MAESNIDLWPPDIVVDVLSPQMILNEQAEALAKRTQGILRGEVLPGVAETFAQLNFDIVAPAVGLRQRLLSARYSYERPYPVVLIADPFVRHLGIARESADYAEPKQWKLSSEREESQARLASTPNDVRDLLKLLFHAATTKAALLSLIARSNEVTGTARTSS
jgi:hypothetical protein